MNVTVMSFWQLKGVRSEGKLPETCALFDCVPSTLTITPVISSFILGYKATM